MITFFDAWRRQRRIQNTQRQLHGLSDHILADIGICRGDIGMAGRGETLLLRRTGR